MLKVLKNIKFLTNPSQIYKWALCQVSFENLTIIGALKTLYAIYTHERDEPTTIYWVDSIISIVVD